jgi:hypothetical protein
MNPKSGILVVIFLLYSILLHAQPFSWVKTAGGTGATSGKKIALDAKRNIFTCGKINGSATFGSTTITTSGSFFAKYDNNGQPLWSIPLKGIDCKGIATDQGGFSYLTGSFNGICNFDGTTITSQGNSDFFIAKFDPTGFLLWVKTIGGPGNDFANDIITDYQGDILITGSFENYVNFNSTISLLSAGQGDIFIAQFDWNGNVQWAAKAGGNGNDAGTALGADLSGNIYLAGKFSNTASFYKKTASSNGGYDIFVTKYNSLGLQLSLHTYGGSNDDIPNNLSIDGSGNLYITGTYNGSINFDGKTITSSQNDGFVAAFNPSTGNANWVQNIGGTGYDAGLSLIADGGSNVFVTGVFSMAADFGGKTLQSIGNTDIYVAKYDALGHILWVYDAGGILNDTSNSICIDPDDAAYITGSFQSKVLFGNINVTSSGTSSYFFAKMAQDPTGVAIKTPMNIPIEIYPNPAGSFFYINNEEITEIRRITILNSIGENVLEIHDLIPGTPVDIRNLAPGMYVVRLNTTSYTYTMKIFKR